MGLDPDQLAKAADAFLKSGFNRPTMIELAVACGFSRRALYYHYRNKEELFRDVIRYQNERAMYAGWTAGMNVLMEGGGAVDVITAFLDTRFGETRRSAANSPYALELADSVFRLCDDIIVELQVRLQEDLIRMIEMLQTAGKLLILPDVNKDELAAMLAAAVRGVNQTRPHLKDVEFQPRYYAIIKAILRGSAKMPAKDRRRLEGVSSNIQS
ncbi:MAG: TetR/AcrR family transcriptional regulator [Methylovirgula sp.]